LSCCFTVVVVVLVVAAFVTGVVVFYGNSGSYITSVGEGNGLERVLISIWLQYTFLTISYPRSVTYLSKKFGESKLLKENAIKTKYKKYMVSYKCKLIP
jgi:preprotein translocase subunit SecG